MKNQDGQHRMTIAALLLVLAIAFLYPSTVQASEDKDDGGAIVGLWLEHYTSDFGPQFDTYSQWHEDGLEIETPSFLNGVCMGTFKKTHNRTFKLFHVGWTPGGIPPASTSVRFELRQLNTVSQDGNTFDGTYDQKFFDANGTLVLEDHGQIHGTRLTVALY